jgi:protein-disulfide isomerase
VKSSAVMACLTVLLSFFLICCPAYADEDGLSPTEQAQVYSLIHDHLFDSPSAGSPKADVTIVEFFDYQCGYCRKMAGVIARLLKADAQVRVVFKEVPMYGEPSLFAARATLAAERQEKYFALHSALMKAPLPFSNEQTLAIASSIGLDAKKLQADMKNPALQKQLQNNAQLILALHVPGTPAFVILRTPQPDDNKIGQILLIPGAAGLAELQKWVNTVRHS